MAGGGGLLVSATTTRGGCIIAFLRRRPCARLPERGARVVVARCTRRTPIPMSNKLEIIGLAAAAVTLGTVYVLVHEARRKHKNAAKAAREAPISKEMLLKILNKSADASKAVIERVCWLCGSAALSTCPFG